MATFQFIMKLTRPDTTVPFLEDLIAESTDPALVKFQKFVPSTESAAFDTGLFQTLNSTASEDGLSRSVLIEITDTSQIKTVIDFDNFSSREQLAVEYRSNLLDYNANDPDFEEYLNYRWNYLTTNHFVMTVDNVPS